MAFELCTHCKETLSSKAEICPHCGHPQKTKSCIKCSAVIGSRRKKCPECDAYQYPNVQGQKPIEKKPVKSEISRVQVKAHNPKQKSQISILVSILVVLVLGLGGVISYELGFWTSKNKPDDFAITIPEGTYIRQTEPQEGGFFKKIGSGLRRAFNCGELFSVMGRKLFVKGKTVHTQAFTDAREYLISKVEGGYKKYSISIPNIDQDGEIIVEFFHEDNDDLVFICGGEDQIVYSKVNLHQ